MNLTPTPPPSTAQPAPRRTSASSSTADASPDTRDARQDRDEPDWQRAYQRRRTQDDDVPTGGEPQPGLPAALPWAPREQTPELAPLPATAAVTTSTVERIDALRQLTDAQTAAAPAERSWQVDLPAIGGAAWQLQVQQAQPLAPLTVELRVPPVAQTQARQQLSDLDKRLRDAGHDVLRSRLREHGQADKRSLPVDGVGP